MDYIKNVTGSEHIGIGADYDGPLSYENYISIFQLKCDSYEFLIYRVAEGLEDVSKYPILFDKLAETNENRTGWSRQELRNLAGENMIRVMTDVEKYRDLQKEEIKENSILDAEVINKECRVPLPTVPTV